MTYISINIFRPAIRVKVTQKMSRTTPTLISRLISMVILVGIGHAQVCLTGVKDGPSLPTFPDQFSAEIEANIIHLNLTLHVTEYYAQQKVISDNKKDCLTIRNILLKSRNNHLSANGTLVLSAL